MQIPCMKLADQITLRIAGPLRAQLDAEAAALGRSVSNLIRYVLIERYADLAARGADRPKDAAQVEQRA